MATWTKEDVILAQELFAANKGNAEIAEQLGKSMKGVRLYLNKKLNLHFSDQHADKTETVECLQCQTPVTALKSECRRFCSRTCSVTYNNARVPKRKKEEQFHDRLCPHCGRLITGVRRAGHTHCSSVCQREREWETKCEQIAQGATFSHYVMRKYLIHVHGASCMLCGWDKVNPATGNVPIQLEHVDGNYENNKLVNLKLLCPNCHSLTPTYMALNRGNGRVARRERRLVKQT